MEVEQLIIPILGSDEVVVVPVDSLPDDPEEILDILRAEEAPLGHWLDFAKAYLQQDKAAQYVHILEEGSGSEVKEFFEKKGEGRHERIQFMCALAAYHTQLAKSAKDRQAQTEHFQKANQFLVQSRSEDQQAQLPYLGLGYMHLAKGDKKSALREFELATKKLHNGRQNVSGYLAVASVNYQEGNFAEALGLYRRALQEHPGGPAELRLGLGLCHFALGDFEKARRALERALALDPRSCEALLALATLHLVEPGRPEAMSRGAAYLRRAYEVDPGHPGVLCQLAHLHLLRGEYESVRTLAQAAHAASDQPKVKAEALTFLARSAHAMGERLQAPAIYMQACRLDPKLPLPHYGLAQMYCYKREYKNAISELEVVLASAPGNYDALRLLGSLYAHAPQRVSNALDHFQAAAKKSSRDPAVYEMLGELLAPSDPKNALAAYRSALEGHERLAAAADDDPDAAPHVVPAQLLNNAAVLHHRGGHKEDALSLIQRAVQTQEQDGLLRGGAGVTMRYNLARMREAAGQLQDALLAYNSILEERPDYIDCHLRLACIARNQGRMPLAVEHAERAAAAATGGGDADALALLGALHLERRDWPMAHKYLGQLVGERAKDDTYGCIAQGNLNLYTAPTDRRRPESRQKAELLWDKALDRYRRVLQRHPSNIYAANGLGAVLAEQGNLESAWEVFKACAESSSASGGFLQMPDVIVNMGTIHLARQDYASAIKVYTNALARFHNNKNVAVLLLLARAHYDRHDLVAAKTTLLKAVHLAPTDCKLRFNTALTMQEYAVSLLRKKHIPGDPSTLEDYRTAIRELTSAARFFQHLEKMGRQRSGVDPGKIKSHIKFCTSTYNSAQTYLKRAEQDMARTQARRDEQAKKLQLAAKQKEIQAELAKAKARDEEIRIAKLAEEARARLSNLQASWKNTAALEAAVSKGDASALKKPTQVEQVDAMFDEGSSDDEDYDEAAQAADAKEAAEAEEAADRHSDGEEAHPEEGGEKARPAKKRRPSEDGAEPKKKKKRISKKAAVVEDAVGDAIADDTEMADEEAAPAPHKHRGAALDDSDLEDDVEDGGEAAPTGGGEAAPAATNEGLFGSDED